MATVTLLRNGGREVVEVPTALNTDDDCRVWISYWNQQNSQTFVFIEFFLENNLIFGSLKISKISRYIEKYERYDGRPKYDCVQNVVVCT